MKEARTESMMFPVRLFLLMALPWVVSCQSTPSTVTGNQVQEKLTKLKFPMTRAELAEHIPAVGLEKEPRVLLDAASPHTRGTEYCKLGDGLLLVMPVNYKHVVSHQPSSEGATPGQGGGISILEVRTDADDVVKGAVLAANRGATCTNCTTANLTKMLIRGL